MATIGVLLRNADIPAVVSIIRPKTTVKCFDFPNSTLSAKFNAWVF